MAIQVKGRTLPLNITVTVGQKQYKMLQFDADPPLLEGSHEGFVIRENIPCSISFQPEGSGYDEKSFLKIDTHIDSDDCQEGIIIKPGEEKPLFAPEDEQFPFRLGYTVMQLNYDGSTYEVPVEVVPIYYSREQVKAVHNYLESQLRNICYDLISHRSMVKVFQGDDVKWYREYGRFHRRHESEIISFLSKAEAAELKNIVKTYRAEPFPRQIDGKSIRKSLTVGLRSASGSERYFNKKAVEAADEKRSMRLKYLLYKWRLRIEEALAEISREMTVISEQTNRLKREMDYNDRKRCQINNLNVSKRYTQALPLENNLISKKIDELEKYRREREQWSASLNFIKNKILFLLTQTELSAVPLRPAAAGAIKGGVLGQIKRLYDDSETLTQPGGSKKQAAPVPKPTWQVFEYFVVSKLLELISRLGFGFKITSGIDAGLIENIIENGIPEGAAFRLENESHAVKLVYDEPLERSKKDALAKGRSFYTFSQHNRPDLRLELYRRSGGEEKLLAVLIVEIKFRRFANLYSSDAPTETMCRLNDYSTILCCYPDDERGNRYIDKVICIYGGSGSSKKNCEDVGYFIRLSPEVDEQGGIRQLAGEEELSGVLTEWLDNYLAPPNEERTAGL